MTQKNNGYFSKSNEYWSQKSNTKKLVLQFLFKWWMILAGTLVGIVLGCVSYFIYHAVADGVLYSAYSEFYLDFAEDSTGKAYQYYNGYTWNDLMSTELIAGTTLEILEGSGIDLSHLEAATLAEVKSDIRVLRVTITDEDQDVCVKLQKATETSLEKLGESAKEFVSIQTIKSMEPVRVYADDRLKQAILLGGLICLIITLLAIRLITVLDDRILTPADMESIDVPVLGVQLEKDGGRTAELLKRFCEVDCNKVCEPSEADVNSCKINISKLIDETPIYEAIKVDCPNGIILEIPYGKVSTELLSVVLNSLKTQEITVLGVIITEANNVFYKLYL